MATDTATDAVPSLREHLAAQLRAHRGGQQQTEVAARMRALGFSWTQSTVAAVEAVGTKPRDLDLAELAALCGVYGVDLAELLQGPGRVTVGGGAVVRLASLREALERGAELRVERPETETRRLDRLAAEQNEATRHAARALSKKVGHQVRPGEVADAASALWGCSLAAERDSRLDERYPGLTQRQRQALRGHVTRSLLDDLRTQYFELPAADRPGREDPFPEAVDASGREEPD